MGIMEVSITKFLKKDIYDIVFRKAVLENTKEEDKIRRAKVVLAKMIFEQCKSVKETATTLDCSWNTAHILIRHEGVHWRHRTTKAKATRNMSEEQKTN